MIKKIKDMSSQEKIVCYRYFLQNGNYDSFEGFCDMMKVSSFNSVTGEPIEIKWATPLDSLLLETP